MNSTAVFNGGTGDVVATSAMAVDSPTLQAHLSQTKFSSFVNQYLLSSAIAIPFETCTDVQAQTLPVILQKGDVLAQAKTGTGKTLAFLLPTIQNLILSPPSQHQISALIIAPTRELAAQIATAGHPLLRNLDFKIQISVGGVNPKSELRRLKEERCDILVATPGRLLDHLQNGGLQDYMRSLRVLVLDEADRLLDQGFHRDLQKIVSLLPDRSKVPRQSLLFSATIPEGVQEVAKFTLDPNHTFISTLAPDEINTHEHVPQFVQYTDVPDFFSSLVTILRQEIAQITKSKIMLFLPTARSTGLVYSILSELPGNILGTNQIPIWQIHSRMSQSARNKSADSFKTARNGILVTSDVTARGMDFPLVTLVLQAGLPADAEQYIHRLGRTARAGEGGRGVLLLCSFERFFLRQPVIRDLPIQPYPLQPLYLVDKKPVEDALDRVPNEPKAQAWAAWLGYYKSFQKRMGWTVPQLVQTANDFAQIACRYVDQDQKPPPILAKTVGMMGLRDYRHLFNIVSELPAKEGGGGKPQHRQGNQRQGIPSKRRRK